MSRELNYIRKKIGGIRNGLLRCRDEEKNESWQVQISPDDKSLFHFVVEGDDMPGGDVDKRQVTLIQKDNDNYLYITGKAGYEVKKGIKQLTVSIMKACWFIRRRKGSVSWLQEKYLYENYTPDAMEMAS